VARSLKPNNLKIDGQTLTALSVLLLALLSLSAGACMLLAGLARYQADAFIEAWEKRGVEPQAQAWNIAHAAAQRAVAFYPVANGDYLDRLGRVQAWRHFRHPVTDLQAQHSRQAALHAYQASVVARPTWPYTWARLAHTKLLLQQIDSEFDEALNRAFELGPWRIGVNRELMNIGFNAWPKLSENQRLAILKSARRSVLYSTSEARQALKVAQQTGINRMFCTMLDSELKKERDICL